MMSDSVLLSFLILVTFDSICTVWTHDSSSYPTPFQLIGKHGYPSENHWVTTEDGYILNVHRIPHGKNKPKDEKPGLPVLLVHGFLSSAADFVSTGPQRGLAFLLADEGYDVWLGNARGNTFSRNHTTLDPNVIQFWDFSFHEHGVYDLPAMIDYVLDKTSQESLYYAGHSQGTTNVFVTLSMKPEYNKKLRLTTAIAPEIYFEHLPQALWRLSTVSLSELTSLAGLMHMHELLPYRKFHIFYDFCAAKIEENRADCITFLHASCGYSTGQIDIDDLLAMLEHFPAGGSFRQFLHFTQMMMSKKFRQFDHGTEKNMQVYGQDSPPEYNVSMVTSPVAVFHAGSDQLASILDAKYLYDNLKNPALFFAVDDRGFSHIDLLLGKDTVELVFKKIIDLMKKY